MIKLKLVHVIVVLRLSILAHAMINPKKIRLRVGVMLTSPFTGHKEEYAGFEPELLDQIEVIAKRDGVDLEFVLSDIPQSYERALNLVANDCNTTVNPNFMEDCNTYDMLIGHFYPTSERSMRVHFSPSWLRITRSMLKYSDRKGRVFETIAHMQAAGGKACADGFHGKLAMKQYPGITIYDCPHRLDCIAFLKSDKCSLYIDDELVLRHIGLADQSLELTRETFSTQYLAWPLRTTLNSSVIALLDSWVYEAISNGVLDKLYHKYFAVKTCPIGTAGPECALPCDPTHGEADKNGKCICESTKWTGDDCTKEVIEDKNLVSFKLKLTGYIMFGITAATVISCAIWLQIKRDTKQVKAAQPFFLDLVLVGSLVSSSAIIALEMEDSDNGLVYACAIVPWLYSMGFCITYGSLFAKIRRVYILFKSAANMTRLKVTVKETLVIISVVVLVDAIILTVWTTLDPLRWNRIVLTEDKFGETLSSQGFCTSEYWKLFAAIIGALHFILLIIASYFCYVTRNIATKFSEGKYLSLAIISNIQVFLIAVPVLLIIGPDTESNFFVRCTVVWINDLVVVFLIFGNLVYSVHISKDDVSIESAMKSYMDPRRRISERRSLDFAQISEENLSTESAMKSYMDSRGRVSERKRLDVIVEKDISFVESRRVQSSQELSHVPIQNVAELVEEKRMVQ